MSYCPRWLDAARASGDAYVALRDIPGGDFEAEYSLGAANQHYLSMVLIAAVTPSERYR